MGVENIEIAYHSYPFKSLTTPQENFDMISNQKSRDK